MAKFDYDFAKSVVTRLKTIPPDRQPEWGKMSPAQMLGHLTDTLNYCMGRRGEMPDKSTWKTRNIYRPLILNGFVQIPKNVKLPSPKGTTPPPMPDGDLETFQAAIEEYLAKVQAGELDPPRHPFFGNLGVDGWAKFHARHMDHHLRQFGA